MKNPAHSLITGASSGLGAALAQALARPNCRLSLLGRDVERLESVAKICRNQGSEAHFYAADVTDRAAMEALLLRIDDSSPIDLVIANAGISGGTSHEPEGAEQSRLIFRTNIEGTTNTVLPLLPRLIARRHGHIALLSSLAGFRGMPGAPAYCASKAAIRVWGEALRADLAGCNVGLSVICPGFVKTPMTDANSFSMPFLMEPERAAALIVKGIERNQARIAFPFPLALAAQIFAALPPGLTDRILARFPRK